MQYIVALVVLILIASVINRIIEAKNVSSPSKKVKAQYLYSRKSALMTAAEASFYRRLETVASDRYYIFPQIHLSALLINQTKGRYWKAAFQRINRTSVDYVLCDKQTMTAVYAVELDDSTHDTAKRKARDAGVEQMLASVGLPLIRFRGVSHMTDDDIAKKFEEAASHQQQA